MIQKYVRIPLSYCSVFVWKHRPLTGSPKTLITPRDIPHRYVSIACRFRDTRSGRK